MATISGNPVDGFTVDDFPFVWVCIWILDIGQWGSNWQSGCKDAGVDGINTDDDDLGPLQWDWRFCPYCGLPIIQRSFNENE